MAPKKVLIIGMDGFTWRIGRDLIDKGLMPTLAKLTGLCYNLFLFKILSSMAGKPGTIL